MEPELCLIRIEPKYCELCGGLWLRVAASECEVCPRCRPLAAELALARRASTVEGRDA